ncbi:DEAD/DEAH box helicase [Clostridium arbusti]|uniref:DEAD/DEAH box helicase n=1 Tax=Clostridium arbusti TaxID=1137848 RepID=UPI0002894ACD|nr:DEAD/DEAH box helicase [Clostridium arbusti]
MNIEELGKIIFKPSSSLMQKNGEDIFKDGLVSNIKGKKIDDIYHIYGEVIDAVNYNKFKTHIKINLEQKKLSGLSCSCDDFKNVSMYKTEFMCQHLTATAYKFLSSLHKKKYRQKNEYKEKKKAEVAFDVKINCRINKEDNNYEIEFLLGSEHKYLIADLKGFIDKYDNNKNIILNSQFTYKPKQHSICLKSRGGVDFIKEYIHKDKKAILGKKLIIKGKDLRRFLEIVGEKKIQFKYNSIEYKVNIFKENLPLSFTLKEKGIYFALTTHKKLPIPLNINRDVYFFKRHIYLPSVQQVKRYSELYSKFQKNNEILYNKTIGNYNNIILLLDNISSDITITEGVKKFGLSSLSYEFRFYKEEENIYCSVYANYYKDKINILDCKENEKNIIRDIHEEEKMLMKLEYYKLIRRQNRMLFIGEDEDLFNIVAMEKTSKNSLGHVVLGKGLEYIKIYDSSSIGIDIQENNEGFKLNYDIGNIKGRELYNAFESYKTKNKFYKIRTGVFIDLQDEGVISFLNLIDTLQFKNQGESSLYIDKNKAFYVYENLKNKSFRSFTGLDLLEDLEKELDYRAHREIPLPKELRANLRQYQIDGFKWFENLNDLGFGGILADEMGLGKTVQTIAFLISEKGKKALIITPTSLIYNWKDEIERFAPRLRVGVAHGNMTKQEKLINELQQYDVILTTYGTLRNNISIYEAVDFDHCIIDEAQNIKNPIAQSTMAVKRVKSKTKFALTGTPVENNLTELWSIFDFVMPGYLYSKEIFYEKFIFNNEEGLENLKLLIKPFILRRIKMEVIEDLPDKMEKKMLVEMTSAQKAIYNTYIRDIREKMKNNSEAKIEVFSYLTRLRQICLDPSLVIEEYKGGSGKVNLALQLIEKQIANNGKLLLFSQFTSVLNKIGHVLNEKGIEYFHIYGSTNPKERIKLVNEFNNGDKVKVFLISLKAGGTGLNLTSANLVIHFDPWWNPAVEDQATDRAHRIGQKNIVEVIKLVSRGTIEEKIILLQESKKQLIDSIITGELKNSNILNKLSKEELIQLFNR